MDHTKTEYSFLCRICISEPGVRSPEAMADPISAHICAISLPYIINICANFLGYFGKYWVFLHFLTVQSSSVNVFNLGCSMANVLTTASSTYKIRASISYLEFHLVTLCFNLSGGSSICACIAFNLLSAYELCLKYSTLVFTFSSSSLMLDAWLWDTTRFKSWAQQEKCRQLVWRTAATRLSALSVTTPVILCVIPHFDISSNKYLPKFTINWICSRNRHYKNGILSIQLLYSKMFEFPYSSFRFYYVAGLPA